ncbi:MAG: TIR domain-containing protein [Lachnospiraceae bacterium]|nr:TIR domain-containing protein [Lachnospiraceae bacterium]
MFSNNNNKWEADAGNLSDFTRFDAFVYRNGSVKSFLEDSGKTFVIAAKGVGKTLLLSYKRYLLEKKYSQDNDSISLTFIPNNHPYISFVESIKTTLSNEHLSVLQSWEYCKKLWVLIIELCVISYSNIDIDPLLDGLPDRAQRHRNYVDGLIRNANSIEYIFNEIISLNESTLTKLVEDISNYISNCFTRINHGIVIFLDRFDNALETSHDEIWTPIQVGLLEAAWDVMRSNRHIKIYLSIRQEAYAAHTSRNANAISTSVIKIEYTRAELKELVNHLVQFYEGYPTLEKFLGFESFPNTVTFMDENVFDFMFRYSIGRPRDFVQFCGELSMCKDSFTDLSTKRMKLKEKVRTVSSDTIINSLFDELRMLMKCLKSLECFKDFLIHLRHNVLTYGELMSICREYNKGSCINDCKNCSSEKHPFCDLFNMGLLGTVERPTTGIDVVQKFKTPYEDFTNGLRGDVDFFLVHPALREYINTLHKSSSLNAKYELYIGILVGSDLPWTDKNTELYYINKLINEIKNKEMHAFFVSILEKSLKTASFSFPTEVYNRINENNSLYEKRIIDSLIQYFDKRKLAMPKPITIFVSYAYDNEEHKEKVESFVEMLLQMGFDAKMDSMLKSEYPDIDQMMIYGLNCDKIVIVLSPEYKRKADNNIGGVWKEFKMIADDLEKNPRKYIFVSFDSFSEELKEKISPKRIGNRWVVDLKKGKIDNYNELIAFIKEEKEYPFSKPNSTTVAVVPKKIKPFN